MSGIASRLRAGPLPLRPAAKTIPRIEPPAEWLDRSCVQSAEFGKRHVRLVGRASELPGERNISGNHRVVVALVEVALLVGPFADVEDHHQQRSRCAEATEHHAHSPGPGVTLWQVEAPCWSRFVNRHGGHAARFEPRPERRAAACLNFERRRGLAGVRRRARRDERGPARRRRRGARPRLARLAPPAVRVAGAPG
jgi:hypothetical protein